MTEIELTFGDSLSPIGELSHYCLLYCVFSKNLFAKIPYKLKKIRQLFIMWCLENKSSIENTDRFLNIEK